MKTCWRTIAFLKVSFAVCLALDVPWAKAESPNQVYTALSNLFSQPKSISARLLPPYDADECKPLVEANTAFALDLFNQLKTDSSNLFFSPYGVSTTLALTYAGARGQTGKQMCNVLHFTNVQDAPSHFGLLQRHLIEVGWQKGVELSIANALWIEQSYSFLPAFLSMATGPDEASMNQADFKTGAEAARARINAWVARQTRDKIQNILPPGCIDEDTRMVLANAIYFKGLWDVPFEKTRTANQPFHISPTNQLDVPLMHKTAIVGYTENSDFQAVAMSYQGGLDMMVFLPRQFYDCARLESSLTPTFVSTTLLDLHAQEVEIFLPRFKLESTFRLNDVLSRMGMPNAFGTWADFSGIDGTTNLYISEIFHRSWCEVTEEGTEAVATTAIDVLAGRGMRQPPPPPPPIFRADHPFVFFIRDSQSGSILFLGRLAHPKQ